ncbi:MAG: hypothetical protein ACTHZ9_08075 [Leucobacter sp.]
MFGADWWAHALIWGGVASVGVGAVLTTVLMVTPYAFFSDYPEDIRRAAEDPTPRQRRAGLVGGIVFLVALLASLGAVVVSWGVAHPQAGFFELVLMAFVAIMLFVAVDLIVVDWLIICTWMPRAIVLPGTEECAGWRDYGYHFREQFRFRGLFVLLIGSVLLGGIAWVIA